MFVHVNSLKCEIAVTSALIVDPYWINFKTGTIYRQSTGEIYLVLVCIKIGVILDI